MTYEWRPKNLEDLACYWMKYYARAYKSASSIVRDEGMLRRQVLPYLGIKSPRELTTIEIEHWFLKLRAESGLADKSCNDVLGLLRKIYADGIRWGFVHDNPAARVRKLPIRQQDYGYWCPDEVTKFLDHFTAWPVKPDMYWACVLALYTGLRRGEVVALKWRSVDFDTGIITVKESYCRTLRAEQAHTKSGKIRYVPIPQKLASSLEMLREISPAQAHVLPHLTVDTMHRHLAKMAESAGVPVIRFHDLRHTFASNFIRGGGSLYDLQKILGHSTIQVTERYAHLDPRSLRGKSDCLEF